MLNIIVSLEYRQSKEVRQVPFFDWVIDMEKVNSFEDIIKNAMLLTLNNWNKKECYVFCFLF